MQHSSNPANAALKSEFQVFSKQEQLSVHPCLAQHFEMGAGCAGGGHSQGSTDELRD